MTGDPLTRHELDELYGIVLLEGIESAVTVLGGPTGPPIVPPSTYRRLAADLCANGGKVVADLSGDPLAEALAGGVDVLKISEEELIAEGRMRGDDPAGIVDALRALVADGAGQVVATRAAEPAVALDRSHHFRRSTATAHRRGPSRSRRLADGWDRRHPRQRWPARRRSPPRCRRRGTERHPAWPGNGHPRRDRAARRPCRGRTARRPRRKPGDVRSLVEQAQNLRFGTLRGLRPAPCGRGDRFAGFEVIDHPWVHVRLPGDRRRVAELLRDHLGGATQRPCAAQPLSLRCRRSRPAPPPPRPCRARCGSPSP